MKRKKTQEPQTKNWAFERKRLRPAQVFFTACCLLFLIFIVSIYICSFTATAVFSGEKDNIRAAGSNTPPNSFNMLFAVLDTEKAPISLLLIRLDAPSQQIIITPVPPELAAGGTGLTLAEEFSQGRADDAVSGLEKTAGITINYRCSAEEENFSDLIDLFGGFVYELPEAVSYPRRGSSQSGSQTVEIDSGANLLDGTKALGILTCAAGLDDQKRFSAQAGMMQAFLTQKLSAYYLGDNGSFFKKVFNLVSTNYSMNALLTNLTALQEISEKEGFVTVLIPSVEYDSGGTAHLDKESLSQIAKNFS